ncbi:MAG: NADP oxidoreductase [Chloroflexota bacterium]
MSKVKVATVWLDGCSGCHMSFLDIDERLLELADKIDLVYSPLVDQKEFPPDVDVTLVEGAVSSEGDLKKIRHIRERTKILVSLGDCAVTGNVPSMRNPLRVDEIMERVYLESDLFQPQVPTVALPPLLAKVRPVHMVVKVDVYVPGCPPSADTIFFVVSELLAGRLPDLSSRTRFGA